MDDPLPCRPAGAAMTRLKPSHRHMALVLGALTAFGPLAIDTYLPSFPAISGELGVEAGAVQVTVAVYFLGLALGQLCYGPVADRFGRKRPLYAGLLLFVLASAGCALARGIDALILLRLLQALGGSALLVIARAVVRDFYDERESARVLSLLMLVMGLAPILAPLLGGQLVALFGWRSIFWLLAAFALLCLLAVRLTLPESLPPEARRRRNLATILADYLTLLGNRPFMAHVLSGGLISAGMFAYIAGSPFVFMEIFGVSPERFGLFFGANALGLIAFSQINARLVRSVAPAVILTVVLPGAATAGLLLLAAAATGIAGFPGILAPLFLFVSSLGFVAPNATALAMAPQGRNAGSAAAVLGMTQFLCGGVAGGLVSALYDRTALPMALVIAVCGHGAATAHLLFGRRR